ncbi:MAG: FumA C-terminus/TtdB family hydratase beta subunit [Candidatus Omnitrophota bacterium]
MQNLKTGNEILFSGIIYTARDQAHKRLVEAIKKRKELPFNLKGAIIYYCGPTAAAKGKIIGSCGPTTSSRMDAFAPILLRAGLIGMIGKGGRSPEVIAAIRKYKGVYFLTYAGCGALLARYVRSKKLVAYPDLGPEAIYRLEVKDFPLIVAIDARGRDIYAKK